MIPFDMARFDGLKEAATGTVERRRPVVDRILETAKVDLNSQNISPRSFTIMYSVCPCALFYILQKSHVTLEFAACIVIPRRPQKKIQQYNYLVPNSSAEMYFKVICLELRKTVS